MIDFSRLLWALVAIAGLLGANVIVFLRWWRKARQRRRSRALGPEDRLTAEAFFTTTRTQRVGEWGVVGLGALTLVCVAWGFVEPGRHHVTQHRISSPKLRSGQSIRLVHLSDLHCEATPHLEPEVVKTVQALKPDLILFTGDAINVEEGLPTFRRIMTLLAQVAPTYAVWGNWETWWFPDADLYGRTGVQPLDGRAEAVTIHGQTLWLIGVGVDREAQLEQTLAQVDKGSFVVLLHHFPALAPRAARLGVDLMLSGDTHGGQAWLPLLGELVRIRRHGFWRPRGMHREEKLWLYVNSGIGNEGGAPRFRFATRPEIALLELVPP